MRIFLLLAGMLTVSYLHAQDFEIIEATSQKWFAGRARSGHGVKYKLTIVCKKKLKKLQFEKLWVGKEAFPVKVVKNKHKELSFSKNDTIYLSARKRVITNEYGDKIREEKKEENPPVKLEAAALLSYKVRSKSKHMHVTKFRKLKAIFYP